MACTGNTDSIDLTTSTGILTADLAVDPAIDNQLAVVAAGVRVPADGWIPLPATLAFSSATAPRYVATTSINLQSIVAIGTKLKVTQAGTVRCFVVVAITASTMTLYSLDGSVLAASAITLPYFSPNQPNGFPFAGPLVINDAEAVPEINALFYDASYGKWVSPAVPVYSAFSTIGVTSATYAAVSGAAPMWLPFRALTGIGATWQFRWTMTVTWAAGQTSWGAKLATQAGDYGAAPAAAGSFAEVTAFVANATQLVSSGWVDLDPSIVLKDAFVIVPFVKSDGTRVVSNPSISVGLSVRGRLVI